MNDRMPPNIEYQSGHGAGAAVSAESTVPLVVDLDDSLRQLQVHAAAREASVAPGADVLHSQHEVDELLAQLGV